MKETKPVQSYLKFAVILLLFVSITSCEKTKYDLLDPESAGVWTLFTTDDGLPGNKISDIKLDGDGTLWIAFTNSGVATYKDGSITKYNTSTSSILNNYSTSLGPMSDGSMIIGTADGLSMKTTNDQWSSYKDPTVTIMYINTVKVTSDGFLWVGTENQGFYFNDGSGFEQIYNTTYKDVNIIEEDSDSNVWLGTDNGLLKWDGTNFSLLTTSDGLPSNEVTALFPDSKQKLWIGTFGGETVSWLDNSGLHQLSLMTGNESIYVRDIFEDRSGDIWFATWFDGLIRYDGAVSHSYKVYNGFYENDVNTIGEDKDGNLWIGLYSEGLVKYTLPLE